MLLYFHELCLKNCVSNLTLGGKAQLPGFVFQHLARCLMGAVNFAHFSGDTCFSV